jgi:hypothetical protein
MYSLDNDLVWAHGCRHDVGGFFLATFRRKNVLSEIGPAM